MLAIQLQIRGLYYYLYVSTTLLAITERSIHTENQKYVFGLVTWKTLVSFIYTFILGVDTQVVETVNVENTSWELI